jgi:hypothetical protein
MSLPDGVIASRVYGTIMDLAGSHGKGRVRFIPTVEQILDESGTNVYLKKSFYAPILNGAFTKEMASTDNPGLSPTDWTYTVIFEIDGVNIKPRTIKVPAGDQMIGNLLPVSASDGIVITKGNPGTPGAPGNPGVPGDSAYQVALDNGFVGTPTEWLASLVGPPGSGGGGGDGGPSVVSFARNEDNKLVLTLSDATTVVGPRVGTVYTGLTAPTDPTIYEPWDMFIDLTLLNLSVLYPDAGGPGVNAWLPFFRFAIPTIPSPVVQNITMIDNGPGNAFGKQLLADYWVSSGNAPEQFVMKLPPLIDSIGRAGDGRLFIQLDDSTAVFGPVIPTAEDISNAVTALIDGAPEVLDTFNELAAALGDNPNLATDVAGQFAQVTTDLAGKSNTGHHHAIADVTDLQTTLDSIETTPGPTGPTGPGYTDAGISPEGELFLTKTDASIVSVGFIKGPAGSPGTPGAPGAPGDPGAGCLVLGPSDPVPGGTPAKTIIFRTA